MGVTVPSSMVCISNDVRPCCIPQPPAHSPACKWATRVDAEKPEDRGQQPIGQTQQHSRDGPA